MQYGQRGMDGGKDPALEPAVNGYISFENGVEGFFIGVRCAESRPFSSYTKLMRFAFGLWMVGLQEDSDQHQNGSRDRWRFWSISCGQRW